MQATVKKNPLLRLYCWWSPHLSPLLTVWIKIAMIRIKSRSWRKNKTTNCTSTEDRLIKENSLSQRAPSYLKKSISSSRDSVKTDMLAWIKKIKRPTARRIWPWAYIINISNAVPPFRCLKWILFNSFFTLLLNKNPIGQFMQRKTETSDRLSKVGLLVR